jgi:hypothetical protein
VCAIGLPLAGCPALQAYLHNLLLQPQNRTGDVAKQVLQTLAIIVQNVRSERGAQLLFSANHINRIVELPFDFENEEVLGFYVSFLKAIALRCVWSRPGPLARGTCCVPCKPARAGTWAGNNCKAGRQTNKQTVKFAFTVTLNGTELACTQLYVQLLCHASPPTLLLDCRAGTEAEVTKLLSRPDLSF